MGESLLKYIIKRYSEDIVSIKMILNNQDERYIFRNVKKDPMKSAEKLARDVGKYLNKKSIVKILRGFYEKIISIAS